MKKILRRLRTAATIILLSAPLYGQEDYPITFSYGNLSFSRFAGMAEDSLPVRFFYKKEWVSALTLKEYGDCKTLRCLLDSLLHPVKLNYIIDDSGNIIITGPYRVILPGLSSSVPGDTIPPGMFLRERDSKAGDITTIIIGNPQERDRPGNVTLTGQIINRDTREPVDGANIFVRSISAGAITNNKGSYSLSLPRGVYLLQFSCIGMTEKRINVNLYGSGQLNAELESTMVPLREVIVSTTRNARIDRAESGIEVINIREFRLLPSSFGETDIIKSLNLIAGVQSRGEGSAGFNVRGGSEDQNLILLYGSPLYNTSHFFGFFSSVNPDILSNVTLYKGGIPARFGGRISSVLDLEAREGSYREFGGNAGISPVAAHVTVEGPFIRDTLSYIFNIRSTYSNWLVKALKIPELENSRIGFNDFNGKISWKINRKDRLDLSAYLSNDLFISNFGTDYTYTNNIVAFHWLHSFSNRMSFNLNIDNSLYKYNIANKISIDEAYDLSHRINSTGLKTELNRISGRNEIWGGLDIKYYSIIPGSLEPASEESLIGSFAIDNENALETSLYFDDKFKVSDKLTLTAGLRLSSFISFGPGDVLLYDPGYSRSISSVIDTTTYGKWKIASRYAGPELRLAANFRMTDNSSLKINYNRTIQYIHLLSNTYSVSPAATWKLCDNYMKPATGDQAALGLYHNFPSGYEASAEAYYKTIGNAVDFKGGSVLTMAENIEQYIIKTKGMAYGLELVLRKNEGRTRYSIAYSYSRSLLRSSGEFLEDMVNSGKWYPSNFDKPNNLILTFQHTYSRRFIFSADYTYSTGRPVTFPIAYYYLNDIKLIQYSDRNRYRIPDYSRLDVSVKLSGKLKSKRIAHPQWIFSVYNVTGNENAYSVYFMQKGYNIYGYKLSVFGRAFPSITFSFDF